jgi:hypothetical protein
LAGFKTKKSDRSFLLVQIIKGGLSIGYRGGRYAANLKVKKQKLFVKGFCF